MDPQTLVRLLGNPTSSALLVALEDGPSYPRALARRLGLTEGQVQKRLKELAAAGLVGAGWRHDGKTFKEYELRVRAVTFGFEEGAIVPRLDAVGPVPPRP